MGIKDNEIGRTIMKEGLFRLNYSCKLSTKTPAIDL